MNKRLDKIIGSNYKNIDDWIQVLNEYRQSLLGIKYAKDEVGLTHQTAGVLKEIIDLAVKFGCYKDEFDTTKMYLNFDGLSLIVESAKTGQTLYLGSNLEGIYLETSFLHMKNLKNMHDDFWEELLELKKYQGFNYEQNSYFSNEVQQKYPELFQRKSKHHVFNV